MLGSLALLLALSLDGTVSRFDGAVLVAAYLGYLVYSYARRERTRGVPRVESRSVARDAAAGLVALVTLLAASFLVLAVVDATVQRLALGGSMVGVGLLVALRRGDGTLGRREGTTLILLYTAFVAGRLLLFAGQ